MTGDYNHPAEGGHWLLSVYTCDSCVNNACIWICLPRQITWLLRLGFILTWHACVCEFLCCHKYHLSNWIRRYLPPSVSLSKHLKWFSLHRLPSNTLSCVLLSHIYPPLLRFPRSESVTLFCFSSGVSVSFEFNSQRTLPTLSSAQFIYTCNPACIHKHTHTHAHTQLYTSSALPHKNNLTHTHTRAHTLDVSAGVVPDRNKWQLPNYLLTVDADAAWDALLIFLFLLPPPFPP